MRGSGDAGPRWSRAGRRPTRPAPGGLFGYAGIADRTTRSAVVGCGRPRPHGAAPGVAGTGPWDRFSGSVVVTGITQGVLRPPSRCGPRRQTGQSAFRRRRRVEGGGFRHRQALRGVGRSRQRLDRDAGLHGSRTARERTCRPRHRPVRPRGRALHAPVRPDAVQPEAAAVAAAAAPDRYRPATSGERFPGRWPTS
jgi:hypothetical protein